MFLHKGHGWNGQAGGGDQSVAHPDAGALVHEEDEEKQTNACNYFDKCMYQF